MTEADWTKQNESCISLRSLCIQNEQFLKKESSVVVHELFPPLVELMRSPRSVLSKSAITTVAFLVRSLGHSTEPCLENVLHTLFYKVADKIKFISSAAEHAIKIVVGHSSDGRVFSGLLSFQHTTKAVESRWAVALASKLVGFSCDLDHLKNKELVIRD